MRLFVNADECIGCETCLAACPYAAIVMKDDKAVILEVCQVCRSCISSCPVEAILVSGESMQEKQPDFDSYQGVMVFAEQRHGSLAQVAIELIGAGRHLADKLGVCLTAAIFGAGQAEAEELIKWGAEKVYLYDSPELKEFNDEPYTNLLSGLIREHKPEIVLAGATAVGRSFVPRVAARLSAGLTADCTSLDVDLQTRNFLQVRPAFGGNIMATILCPNRRPQIATVRPRVMKKGTYDPGRKGEIVLLKAPNYDSRTRVLESVKEASEAAVNLQEVDVIVSGGRGMGGPEGFKLVEQLAKLLGGGVGASRAAVEEGWTTYSHQVGQTGKTVCPKIYIACGISGAIQHAVGMQSSDVIIAINKNADAPIFNVASHRVVADAREILSALIRKL
ncbi:MAG: electron transfer flavoprotein subunit alpha [Candidatus Lindowbacteria bacterium RIFCSPLOWO2_12_FULL_62_27]|nr:MAG: electron transfer flavoprotein subunit alpha [Candidatus Lindowbacteria bacterium RIFCSPLOWO2_02_FULL_62_12]OGH60724.1 MAG: electron transfer flavoprotein subunit alpha [Candidatus Lindowbacteria bacterium RIFCSPLOWO2_12_FULL_62_27]